MGEDAPRVLAPHPDQIGNPVNQDPRLAGTGARQDQRSPMSFMPLNTLPDDSRLWCFGASRGPNIAAELDTGPVAYGQVFGVDGGLATVRGRRG